MAACNSCKTPSASRRRAGSDLLQNSGGVDGLVERFQQAGLGDTRKAGSARAKPADQRRQLQQVFSADTLNSLAEKAGIDPAQGEVAVGQSAGMGESADPEWLAV